MNGTGNSSGGPGSAGTSSRIATGRRTFLSKVGALAGVAGLGGLSGCLAQFVDDPLVVGYQPSFRTPQGPIMVQNGYLDELDVSVDFESGRPRQGFRNGEIEVALMSVELAVKTRRTHDSLRVTAANNVNDAVLLAGAEFAQLWSDHGPDAFEQFHEREGRRFTLNADRSLGTLWLDALDVSHDLIEWEGAGDSAESIDTLFRKDFFDGVVVEPPRPTQLDQLDSDLREVAWTGDVVAHQPAGVTAMRDELWRDEPELAKAVLEKHVKATELLVERPDEAATILSDSLGDDVSTEVVETALRKKTATFLTDPRPIVDETEVVVEYVNQSIPDNFGESISTDDLFEPSLYAEIE